MEPASWFMAANAVVGAVSAMSSADARADSSNAQANISATNAAIARQNATNALQQSNADEERQTYESDLASGRRRAALLGAGIGAEGSAADVYAQEVGGETYKALQVRYRGQVNATSLLNQAGLSDQQAAAQRNSAAADQNAGFLGAASSLLGGAQSLYKSGGSAGSSDLAAG